MSEELANMRIGVLMGGLSSEREVSLKSGAAVLASLQRQGFSAVGIDAGRDLCARLTEEKIDIAFIALHGRYGEDGCVQGALEIMGIPYTGSGVMASSVAMNKPLTKTVCGSIDVDTPFGVVVDRNWFDSEGVPPEIKAPVVVKPADGGSSIGVTICLKDEQIENAMRRALEEEGGRALIEEYIDGVLLAVGILDGNTLPIVEIETGDGFYDYGHKYTPGRTDYHIPARVNGDQLVKAGQMVQTVSMAIGAKGATRSEVILDKSGRLWFIELNTIPGMTETSLLPKAALACGISFDEMTLAILEEALV